jgi:hypothetical protein
MDQNLCFGNNLEHLSLFTLEDFPREFYDHLIIVGGHQQGHSFLVQ